MPLIFVDCEAQGPCPSMGHLTEFGAVEYIPPHDSRRFLYDREGTLVQSSDPGPVGKTFHGVLLSRDATTVINQPEDVFRDLDRWLGSLHVKGGVSFVSDNVAYDWQWINDGLWRYVGANRFGHSGRRISDFYAGLTGNFQNTQQWKRLRITKHDHNPVHDAIGNVEAFDRILRGER